MIDWCKFNGYLFFKAQNNDLVAMKSKVDTMMTMLVDITNKLQTAPAQGPPTRVTVSAPVPVPAPTAVTTIAAARAAVSLSSL